MNELKMKVYQAAIASLKTKSELLSGERAKIIESILEEEKNSAGDKYETSREMISQDLNSLEKQIQQNKNDLDELYRLFSIKEIPLTVQEGALIKLGSDWFMLAVSIGKINTEEVSVFLMSKNSPLGSLLIGKKKFDPVDFRGKTQRIEELF